MTSMPPLVGRGRLPGVLGVSKPLFARIAVRLTLCVAAAVGGVAAAAGLLQVLRERHAQESELLRRSQLVAESLREAVEPLLLHGSTQELRQLVERFGDRERLAGVAVYDAGGSAVAVTSSLSPFPTSHPPAVGEVLESGVDGSGLDRFGERGLHVYAVPLRTAERVVGALAILHDGAFIEDLLRGIWSRTFLRTLAQTVLIALVILVVVHWSIVSPIAGLSDWMRRLRNGEAPHAAPLPKGDLFAPLAREAVMFARHLSSARAAAEELRAKPRLDASSRGPCMPSASLDAAYHGVLSNPGVAWRGHVSSPTLETHLPPNPAVPGSVPGGRADMEDPIPLPESVVARIIGQLRPRPPHSPKPPGS